MARSVSKAYAELQGCGYIYDEEVEVSPEDNRFVDTLETRFKQECDFFLGKGLITHEDIGTFTGDYQERIAQLFKLIGEYTLIVERLIDTGFTTREDVSRLHGATRKKIEYLLALEHYKLNESFYQKGTE